MNNNEASSEFQALVTAGIDALPMWVLKRLRNVVFLVARVPDDEVKQRERIESDDELFGYYDGTPLTERGHEYGTEGELPDTITIFEHAHRIRAGDDAALLERLVKETVWHEVGHYLGLGEEEVLRREAERGHTEL